MNTSLLHSREFVPDVFVDFSSINALDDQLVLYLQEICNKCQGVDPIVITKLLLDLRVAEIVLTVERIIEVLNKFQLGRKIGFEIQVVHFIFFEDYCGKE